ncbi:Deoxyribonucleoside regulator [compost metagenome]
MIIDQFGIKDALIIDSSCINPGQLPTELGRASVPLLESIFRDGDVVGVMAGKTVASAAAEMDFFRKEGLQFVPMVGGWGSDGASWHANSNAMAFANKLKSKFSILHAPALVATEETGLLLREEPEIAKVLELAHNSRVAVVSIGDLSEQATMVKTGTFPAEEIAVLTQRGAVANLCASFLDRSGQELEMDRKNRLIGLTASELRAIPTVIAIAGGDQKADAIAAALKGKWIDILVTDTAAARKIVTSTQSEEC